MATVNGSPSTGHSEMFASTGYYENRIRNAMDDLESLVFSIWYIAGIPLGISNEAEGKVLSREKKAGKAQERILVSEHFMQLLKTSSEFKLYENFPFCRHNVNISKTQRFSKRLKLFALMKCY